MLECSNSRHSMIKYSELGALSCSRGMKWPSSLLLLPSHITSRRSSKNAKDRVLLISPYLKINRRIRDLLEDKDRMKLDVRVVYRNRELQPDENEWLESMASIRTSYCDSLHAKCYLNESEALITSMNLYEFSQVNNDEMGILVSAQEEPDLYKNIYDECMRIVRRSEEIRVTVAKVDAPRDIPEAQRTHLTPALARASTGKPQQGFCLRCRTEIPVDPSKPYCNRCYNSWRRYQKPDYEEKHCHTCGSEHTSTLLKPVCLSCYRKYKDVFEFAVG